VRIKAEGGWTGLVLGYPNGISFGLDLGRRSANQDNSDKRNSDGMFFGFMESAEILISHRALPRFNTVLWLADAQIRKVKLDQPSASSYKAYLVSTSVQTSTSLRRLSFFTIYSVSHSFC
jgi:hypothetical protein